MKTIARSTSSYDLNTNTKRMRVEMDAQKLLEMTACASIAHDNARILMVLLEAKRPDLMYCLLSSVVDALMDITHDLEPIAQHVEGRQAHEESARLRELAAAG